MMVEARIVSVLSFVLGVGFWGRPMLLGGASLGGRRLLLVGRGGSCSAWVRRGMLRIAVVVLDCPMDLYVGCRVILTRVRVCVVRRSHLVGPPIFRSFSAFASRVCVR